MNEAQNETVGQIDYRDSGIHGQGAFARSRIAAGETVIEYVGERISKEESLRRCEQSNAFIFGLDATHDLDGSVEWNPARLFNHSCAPNCEAIEENQRIWIVALRDIQAGEELTYNYGYSLEEYEEHPCRCGSSQCVGFMVAEDFHELLRRRMSVRAAAAVESFPADPVQ